MTLWENRQISLNFKEEDAERLQKETDVFLNEKLPELILSLSSEIAPQILNDLRKKLPAKLRLESKDERGFKKRLLKRWGEPINSLKLLLLIAREFGEIINTDLRGNINNKTPYLTDSLTRLHARGCQVTYEIICLLENGLADGAMSRWRTLHEISTIALLISDYGEGIAERYIAFQHVESWRALQQYLKHHESLGQEPIEEEEIEGVRNTYEAVKSKFGASFANEYGWAAQHLGSQNPKFSDLEVASKIDHFRPYYKMASYSTHANPKGIYFPISNSTPDDLLLAGPSNYGLADPGHNAALSLMKTSVALSHIEPTFDTIVVTKMLSQLASEVGDQFIQAHNELLDAEKSFGGKIGGKWH